MYPIAATTDETVVNQFWPDSKSQVPNPLYDFVITISRSTLSFFIILFSVKRESHAPKFAVEQV